MQNVATPRFYVDLGQYLMAIGYDFGYELSDDERHLMSLNPTKQVEALGANEGGTWRHIRVPRVSEIKYVAWLGHDAGSYMYPKWLNENLQESADVGDYSGVNTQSVSTQQTPEHKGFTIATFADNDNASYAGGIVGNYGKVGAVSIGDYYDIRTPDLSLTMTYEYDGVKSVTTKGGASLSNMTYYKPANWGDGGAWQLGSDEDGNPLSNLRSGRRVWDMSFSYVSDTDLMPKVAAVSNNEAGSYETSNPTDNTLLEGTDFFSVVWNKTLGGHLKFIFNPAGGGDNPNNSPDQWAICKFDMNSLQYKQVAYNVYDVKLKIREVW